jgi:molybdopterin-guanine dinucleotide biosynthesis protein
MTATSALQLSAMSCSEEVEAPTRLVLVEGLPGSGKTSAAKHLARSLRARGIRAALIRELEPDHPVIPRSVMKQAARDDYAEVCLSRWRAFATDRGSGSAEVAIIEGCAFQSTLRFLYANRVPAGEIHSFWESCEKIIAPLDPRLVYLYQPDPAGFMKSRTLSRRGPEWTDKVAAYAQATPRSREHDWQGRDGMVAFWKDYRVLCDELYRRSTTSKLAIDNGDQFWSREHARIVEWVLNPHPEPSPGPGIAAQG